MVASAGWLSWWLILLFIPVVGAIVWINVCLDLAKSFDRDIGFVIGLMIFQPVFFFILAWSDIRKHQGYEYSWADDPTRSALQEAMATLDYGHFSPAESLEEVEPLIELPALMTHANVAGSSLVVDPGFVRLSVGVESVQDLLQELEPALYWASRL